MCDGRTDGRTNANKIYPKFCVSCTISPYPFIFLNDSIPYSILNIRKMCLETRMPPLSAKWAQLPSRIWDLAEKRTWPVYYGYKEFLKFENIWSMQIYVNLGKPKAGRRDGWKDERKDEQTERWTDGHGLHLMPRCVRWRHKNMLIESVVMIIIIIKGNHLPLHVVVVLAVFFPDLIFSSISSYFTLIHITIVLLVSRISKNL